MSDQPSPQPATQIGRRCSDVSRAEKEPLAATASTTKEWLLVEVPGSWPRDVAIEGPLPAPAHAAVAAWLEETPWSRALFVRRPGRARAAPQMLRVVSTEGRAEVRRFAVERHEDLADADLEHGGEQVQTRLVLVCGHGSRDQCCATRGTAVFGALLDALGDDEAWISSHQGGHRFAGNALLLPEGIQLGRLGAESAPAVVERVRAGRIELAHYRGRTYHDAPVQAAEHAIREASGLVGVDDLRLVGVEGATVRFRDQDGAVHEAVVEKEVGPVVPASCGAPPEPQELLVARVI